MFSFYADESGIANIHDSRPWYIFLAIGLNDDTRKAIDDSVTALKQKYFPGWQPHKVEIHSNAIRRAKLEQYPPNPFSTLDEATLKTFTDDLYALIYDAPFEWCGVALNKPEAVKAKGIATASELFKLAFVLLIERLHGWCQRENSLGRLFIDQQEGNLLGGAYHDLIEKDHFDLRADGTGWQQVDNIIERPYFIDSSRSNHTQLTDIIAYDVYRYYADGKKPYVFFNKIYRKARGNSNPITGAVYGLKDTPKNDVPE